MKETAKLILVDDEPLLLESLELIFFMEDDFQVVGTATNGAAALTILENRNADIALVDLRMVGMDGLELIRELRARYSHIKVLVLTTFYDEKNIISAIQNGADGYILKDAGREALVNAVRSVLEGQSTLDNKVMSALAAYMGKVQPPEARSEASRIFLQEMTGRELDICRLLAAGATNCEIAERLFLTKGTVKNYVSKIYDKTDVRDRATLAVYLSKILK
ncbi:two component transcriptional regulator, LuxR family [Sporobacter termitidis DSM 10068]|uniref:Stage 0 sporulation protein A homolog n=1 Tax=Sporobacter termitidis DSM 10068 TaxID=1123282 RepID=A0A1M5WK33_9FIRM|nr:response regulator transcription factor [Sporobacter termitidis]SHH87788.1 two component transcriptional regulator, LuxR family [Sporobacter termitidis DSM 10068]